MPKIITVAIPKGGVGKTTTAVNLAAGLAVLEKRTLLIDLDPSSACSISLNNRTDNSQGGTLELLSFLKSIDQVIQKTEINGLDFIASQVSTFEDEEKVQRLTKNIMMLRNIIAQAITPYEYIIIDCPPYLQGMTNLGLAASDSVVIPVRSANFSINALHKLINHIKWIRKNYNKKLRIEGVLHTMVERHTKVSVLTDIQLYSILGKYIFKTSIPKTTSIPEATFYGQPIILYNANSSGAKAYLNLAKEIIIRNKICPVISASSEMQLTA